MRSTGSEPTPNRIEPLFTSSEVGRQLGVKLCENLGLDPKRTLSLDFHWRPESLPTVTAEILMNEGTVQYLLTLVPEDTADAE